jgi:hypothetical protein
MNKSFKRTFGAGLFILLSSVGAASAASVSYSFSEGEVVVSQDGIRADTSTNGWDLFGMIVTATFGDGSSERLVWSPLLFSEGVESAGFLLEYGGNDWNLSSDRLLTSLQLEADEGNAIFDTNLISEGEAGNSPTTFGGYPFEIRGTDNMIGNIAVTYSGGVIMADAPRGTDTFTDMILNFTGLSGGGFTGAMSFNADLDSLRTAGDLTPISPVPLPAGLPLLLVGLSAFGLYRRKRS